MRVILWCICFVVVFFFFFHLSFFPVPESDESQIMCYSSGLRVMNQTNCTSAPHPAEHAALEMLSSFLCPTV